MARITSGNKVYGPYLITTNGKKVWRRENQISRMIMITLGNKIYNLDPIARNKKREGT
jgi:hypothetical protein